MLYLIGLGLSWKDLSLKALEAIQKCDEIYLETYTSLADFSKLQLERLTGKKIHALTRKQVEETQPFFKQKQKDVALLIHGDPLSATTHTEIILEAKKRKIKIEIIHAPSILAAAAETGLQLYKFGKTASIPFPQKNFKPESFFDIFEQNQKIGAHTLFLLDLNPDTNKFLTIKQAIDILYIIATNRASDIFTKLKLIGCARLGQKTQKIVYTSVRQLPKVNFGKPPYCLIIPAKLNFKEEEFLRSLK